MDQPPMDYCYWVSGAVKSISVHFDYFMKKAFEEELICWRILSIDLYFQFLPLK